MIIIAINSTMRPARAMIPESMIGSGSALPTKAVRGSNKGMPAAQIIPIPKMIPS